MWSKCIEFFFSSGVCWFFEENVENWIQSRTLWFIIMASKVNRIFFCLILFFYFLHFLVQHNFTCAIVVALNSLRNILERMCSIFCKTWRKFIPTKNNNFIMIKFNHGNWWKTCILCWMLQWIVGSKSFRDDWNDNRFVLHNYTVADQHRILRWPLISTLIFNGMLFSLQFAKINKKCKYLVYSLSRLDEHHQLSFTFSIYFWYNIQFDPC